jgi:Tol biopolymer transport system component
MECIFDAQNYLCYLPCVSPDGRQIAFHGICTDISPIINRDIFVIDADGSNLRRITYHPGNDYQPKWSNDGKSLFFVSQRCNPEGTYNIWIVALE